MRTTVAVAALLVLVACKGGNKSTSGGSDTDEVEKPKGYQAPSGTIAGKPFAPNVVILAETSDGGRLGFYAATEKELVERRHCEEPGSGSVFEITRYEEIDKWQVGKEIASELRYWSATGVDFNPKSR